MSDKGVTEVTGKENGRYKWVMGGGGWILMIQTKGVSAVWISL